MNNNEDINNELINILSDKMECIGNIFFIGFMGVGKTTVSSYLGKLLKKEEIEMDKYIEEKEKITIAEIFDKYGEDYFRKCETNILKELQEKDNKIISCGGGIVLRSNNVELMKRQGKIVLLTASAQTIFERVRISNERPILNNNMNVEFISCLMEQRKEKYLKAADLIIDTNDKDIKEVSEEIIIALNKINNKL